MKLKDLDTWLRDLLHFELTQAIDPSQNGIQVSRNSQEVTKVAFAVDASREAFRRAAQWGADMLLVHHGIFWGAPVRLDGTLYQRVRLLVEKDIALFAAHLPLDMHPEVGNNIAIARHLGLEEIEPFGEYKGVKVGFKGVLPSPMTVEEVAGRLTGGDSTAVRSFPFGPKEVRSVGIVSGGAPFESQQAVREGLDLYVTGEPAHGIYHDCLEAGIHVIFAGHYFTETFGVRLLCEKLARETGLETHYLDLPTGL
jgi:dinuclear metal center YbgI/SA1388 family protein